MSEVLAYLGEALRRTYEAVVQSPMPWRMIDKLASLEETCEQRDAQVGAGSAQGDRSSGEPASGSEHNGDAGM